MVSQKQIPKQGVGSKKPNKKRSRSNDGLAETLMETMINFGKKYKETVDAQNFLVYHVSLWKWVECGLSCLKGMLSPKLDTRPIDLPDS